MKRLNTYDHNGKVQRMTDTQYHDAIVRAKIEELYAILDEIDKNSSAADAIRKRIKALRASLKTP